MKASPSPLYTGVASIFFAVEPSKITAWIRLVDSRLLTPHKRGTRSARDAPHDTSQLA